ncbi:FHF complex subunit HOOK interacting protein 2A-like isoform X2 [Liolophura sinensis]|uniref:FHF complex subunit HOOK interacting protein 2A-like isoform X2 n=1 Tax=Liolophura sinensis TaxID=3198878 RepID=UPI003158C92B
MKKRMFSKFTTILQQAVDALAPNLTLQEDFVYHWKAVTNYFIDNKHDKKPIEHTNIPSHLEQMLQILQEEESTCESGSTGPCMEYLLQHKLLETLYTLARTDFPPGMKQTVLVFFTKLLSRIKQPLLPHINVHRAVHRLVKICGEVKAGPAENEEIHFLCTVCSKITADPYLVNFFLDVKKKDHSVEKQKALPSAKSMSKSEFSLVNSLLALSQSADGRVAVKACEGLMLCCSIPEEAAVERLINHTNFCKSVTDRLCHLYKKLPQTLDPVDLECVQAKWGLDIHTDLEDSQSFPGKRNVISFLSWLDYCDQLITMAYPSVASALTSHIRSHFLEAVMTPALLQASETGAILATSYFCRCLRTVCSPLLLNEFVSFVLGVMTTPEPDKENACKIRQVLIDRCNHLSEELCIATLKLFDTLLQKEDSHIIQNLVLRNLLGRGYIQSSEPHIVASDTVVNGSVEETESREVTERDGVEKTEQSTPEATSSTTDSSSTMDSTPSSTPSISPSVTPSSTPSSPVRTEVHKIINSFLMLVPDELKSCAQTTDGDYDVYLRDASRQFSDIAGVCQPWGWPTEPVTEPSYVTQTFHEGTFLSMLMDKFSKILSQPYAVNLQVTSVMSRLCLVPHPNLHEFLLDPFLPVKEGVRTPYLILTKIMSEVKNKTSTDSGIKAKLVQIRQELMGAETTVTSSEDSSLLEGVIVLEEFCKELAAIAFVKHHASISAT